MRRLSHATSSLGVPATVALVLLIAVLPTSRPPATVATPGPSLGSLAVVPAAPRPAAGATLDNEGLTPTLAGFAWTKSTSPLFSSYAVFESTDGAGGPWALQANLTSTSENYSWAYALTPGGASWWEVKTWTDYLLIYSSSTSNVVEVEQPLDAHLVADQPGPSEVELNWTNNASYGGNVSFGSYELFESVNGSAPTQLEALTSVSDRNVAIDDLSAGTSYGFYAATLDWAGSAASHRTFATDSNSISVGTPAALQGTVQAEPGAVDVGQKVAFSCLGLGGVAPYSYNWSFGNGQLGNGSSPSYVYPTAGSFNATCSVQDGTRAVANSTALVVVSPTFHASVSVDDLRAAPGTVLKFTANTTGGPDAAGTLLWNFGDGSLSSSATPTHAFERPGEYNVSLTATDANGAIADAGLTVNVTSVVATAHGNLSEAQLGDPVGFSAAASGGAGGPYNYTWSFGDGTRGYGSALTHAFRTVGQFSPTVTARDALGGESVTNLTTVAVYGALTANISLSLTAPITGQTVDLSAVAAGGADEYTCAWGFGDGSKATGCTTSHSWSRAGTFTVNLTVTDPLAGTRTTSAKLVVSLARPSVGPTAAGPGPAPWFDSWLFVTLVALLLAAVVGLAYYLQRRRSSKLTKKPPEQSKCATCGAGVGHGTLVCPVCGRPTKRAP
jgi:PKD repeat protein